MAAARAARLASPGGVDFPSMRGARRAAILGMLAAASAACEALVGITDRELAPAVDATADGAAGSEAGGLDVVDAQPDADVTVGTGPDAGLDSSTSAEAGDAVVGEAGPINDAGTDVVEDRAMPVEASDAGSSPDGSDGGGPTIPTSLAPSSPRSSSARTSTR